MKRKKNSQKQEPTGKPRGRTPRGTSLEVVGHSGCGLLHVRRLTDGEKFMCHESDLKPDSPTDADLIKEMIR